MRQLKLLNRPRPNRAKAGFFQNASQDLLLALASILFSISIAFIPLLASRIVKGDVGSTVMVLIRSAMWPVTKK